MNMRIIPIELLQRQQAWIAVGAIFQDAHPMCEECGHCKVTLEHAPYGQGQASYADAECDLGQRASDNPTDCPAYADQLAQEPTEESLQ